MKGNQLGLLLLLGLAVLIPLACGGGVGAQTRVVNLSIVGQTLYGAGPGGTVRVDQGTSVTLRLDSDEPLEVFVHGYDISASVKAGATTSVEFTASVPGRFPFMIHALGGDDGAHQKTEVLLGFVEVVPHK